MPGLYDQLESHLGDDDEKEHRSSKPVYEQVESHISDDELNTEVFERVSGQIDLNTANITPAHLLKVPREKKQILLFFLRNTEANLQGVTLETLKASLPELVNTLHDQIDVLVDEGWLIAMGEPPNFRYRVHLQRRPGSDFGFGIWSMLNQRLDRKSGE